MEIEIQNIIKIVKDAAGILSQRDLIGDRFLRKNVGA